MWNKTLSPMKISRRQKCEDGLDTSVVLCVIPLQAILDVMVNLQFTLVETLWKSFWRFSQSSETESLNL